ncbi:MAG: CehA/McbA family metallohydrolase [Deltaproteobacteria bacterium]|nr:CehA/McbA family metallohydrolase [Deltaproteobacteria bacterium]
MLPLPAMNSAWLRAAATLVLAAPLCGLAACDGSRSEPESTTESAGSGKPAEPLLYSRDAKLDTAALLREDLDAPRHPSDGGGRAWIESWSNLSDPAQSAESRLEPTGERPRLTVERPRLTVDSRARFDIVYETGPLGIAEGGFLFLQSSPFWDWDSPQTFSPEAPGYTEVSSDAEGVEFMAEGAGDQLLAIRVVGRGLRAGERIHIRYGAGALGTRVDRFAERGENIWIAVDGDGDGIRALIAESPAVDVVAGEASWLRLVLPTSARPGEAVRLHVVLLDRRANAGVPFTGEVVLEAQEGLELPARVSFAPGDRGRRVLDIAATRDGVYRIRGRVEPGPDSKEAGRGSQEPPAYPRRGSPEPLEATSNPMLVRGELPRLLWGDLHGHSRLSDGTGTPADFYDYAREVAGLDVAALTDHDHWGMRFLDASPAMWEEIRAVASRFYEPGRFVTLLGYEWTSWLYGHRHVLYFGNEGEVYSSMDPRYENPAQLWKALAGQPALTFAHHSAGGPVSTSWAFAPDPVLEPVTEIASVHGSSEADDSPEPIYNPVPGNFVRDTLDHGYVFGFIGSGDSHDGHPGNTNLQASPGSGGLAAIFAEEHSREAVLAALRARRVYATNGPRIWLEVSIDGHPMGSIMDAAGETDGKPSQLRFEIVAEAPIERLDFIRSGRVASVPGEERLEWKGSREIPPLAAGEYHYLRVVQQDRGAAWSSPIYAR